MGFFCFLISSILFTWPHGDLQLRIDDVTQAIAQYPDSIQLYLSRGELYLQHEQFDLAHQDFIFCLQKDFSNSQVLEGISKSLINKNELDSSLYYVNLALDKDSASVSSMEWKARVLFLLYQFCESGQLYETIIDRTASPSPSLFIDASNSWMQCNQSTGYHHAIDILKTGIDRIGHLHVLQKELVHDYLVIQDYKSALEMQAELIDHAVNKAIPLYERAVIYQAANQKSMALTDLQMALSLIERLPENKKNLPAFIELKLKMESLLNQLQG